MHEAAQEDGHDLDLDVVEGGIVLHPLVSRPPSTPSTEPLARILGFYNVPEEYGKPRTRRG